MSKNLEERKIAPKRKFREMVTVVMVAKVTTAKKVEFLNE